MASSTPKSYHQILKSSFVVGGASFVNILLAIVRTKVLAVLLGPAGVGVLGIYNSIVQTASALVGLGIGRSGVRQIAEASGAADPVQIAKSVAAIRRWSLVLALAGAGAVLALRRPISGWAFQDTAEAAAIGWLALAVFAAVIVSGQGAVLQGTRHVRWLAEQSMAGALLATLFGIPLIWKYGRTGLVWFIVAGALMTLVCSWFYVRRVPVVRVSLTWAEYWGEGWALVTLGVVLMATGLLTTGTLLVVRTFLNREMGEEAAGYFQAAFGVSALYLDFIVQAMGTDFYPRLTASVQHSDTCNRLVNEQMEIALLLAAPLILAMLTFSPLIIYLLYSGDFGLASQILRWQMLGSLLKVVAWPVGFILLAKNQGLKYFGCELVWNLAYLGTILLGLRPVGLVITGIGFTAAYVLFVVWVLLLGKWATGFRLSAINQKLGAVFVAVAVLIFLLSYFAPPAVHYALSTTLTLICGWWALKKLYLVVGREKIVSTWRTLTLT